MDITTEPLVCVEGEVERIVYESEDTGFFVGRLREEGKCDLTTFVGNLMAVSPGETVKAAVRPPDANTMVASSVSPGAGWKSSVNVPLPLVLAVASSVTVTAPCWALMACGEGLMERPGLGRGGSTPVPARA